MIHLLWKAKQLNKGKMVKLSNADIALLVINLPDRRKVLNDEQYHAYLQEFNKIRKEKENFPTDLKSFHERRGMIEDRCANAIWKF